MKSALKTIVITIAYFVAALTVVCFAVGAIMNVAEPEENSMPPLRDVLTGMRI